jgi:hypothetical protein
MKQLLMDVMVFEVTPTMLKEAEDKSGRFLVKGVLQTLKTKMVEYILKTFLKEKLKNTKVEKLNKIVHMVN